MRSNLPRSVKHLVEFITKQQVLASMKLGVRNLVEGIPVNDRDSVINAIYVDVCTDAVWMKDLDKAEIEELVCCMFIDDFSKSKEKPMLPLTIRHWTMANYLRSAEDRNWKRVVELAIESLRGGNCGPTLADIIQERSITWDADSLNRMVNDGVARNSKRVHTTLKHKLNCPYCSISLQIDQVFSKTEVRCPTCRQTFNVQP